jgi:hypothetical protein
MKFLGKPAIDDAVLYEEISEVMANYGVNLKTPKTSPNDKEAKSRLAP